MGLDNVGTAATVLEKMRSRLRSRLTTSKVNDPQTITTTTTTSKPVYISRTRSKTNIRQPSKIRPEMIYSILRHLDSSSSL